MPDRRKAPTRLPKATTPPAARPRPLPDLAAPVGSPTPASSLPKCQPFSVVPSARPVAPPIPVQLRSNLPARPQRSPLRFALLVAGISALVAASPFVLVSSLSGSLREAMSGDRLFEGRSVSVAPDTADGVPLIKANPAPYKHAVPAGAEQP